MYLFLFIDDAFYCVKRERERERERERKREREREMREKGGRKGGC